MTSQVSSPKRGSVPRMPPSRLVGAYLSDAKYESLRLLRTPAFSVPILVMPVLFYCIFGVLMADSHSVGAANLTFVEWTVYGVVGPGLFGFGILVAVERGQGLLTFKRALPMPAGSYLAAKLTMAYVFAIAIMVMLAGVGLTAGHITLPLDRVLTVAAVMSLGVLPACAVGLFIGAWAPASSASAFANIVYLGMALLSGLFFPLPPGLQAFRPIWPTYHLAQLAMASAGQPSEGSLLVHVIVLLAITLGLTLLAGRKLARVG